MTDVWVDYKTWTPVWTRHECLGHGGQGVTHRVQHTEKDTISCLKVLSKPNDAERRKRFFREATAYNTSQHPLIPRLLASNAHKHADLDQKLFLITEFISGPTLSKRIETDGSLNWQDAVNLTVELLKAVQYIHDNELVHRDIKPDNIILRDEEVASPVLLDFGLCYRSNIADTLHTENGQEIGNRFLRLPELSVGSMVKHDERSDLAFVGGILFYTLTGILPAVLQDEAGNMPHQRTEGLSRLSAAAGTTTPRLLAFLDRCFNPTISKRHTTSRTMLNGLQSLLLPSDESESVPEVDLAFIKSHLNRNSIVEQKQLGGNCRTVYRAMHQVVKGIVTELKGQFLLTHSEIQQQGTSIQTMLGVAQSDNHEVRFSPRWEIDVQGSEIVVQSSSNFIFRLDAHKPELDGDFSVEMRAHIVKGIRGLIEAPTLQVGYRGFFGSTPFASLAEALTEAKRVNRRVFAVLYDDKHHSLSKLDHSLGYFMEYEATKNFVNEHFVVALVPIRQEKHLVPAGSLEVARWFLLGRDGEILDQKDVYANPDEGLKAVKRLALV